MDSDSYEPNQPSEPKPKQRRPWWRWNLIVLAVSLFVFSWVRKLLEIPTGRTWLITWSILLIWAIGPVPPKTLLSTTIKILHDYWLFVFLFLYILFSFALGLWSKIHCGPI